MSDENEKPNYEITGDDVQPEQKPTPVDPEIKRNTTPMEKPVNKPEGVGVDQRPNR